MSDETTLRAVIEARRRAYPVDALSVAESLLSEALSCIYKVVRYAEPQSAERLDDVLGRALEMRSQLPDGHRLELVLRAFHDGDEKAQVEVVKLADSVVKVSTAVGRPIRAHRAEVTKPQRKRRKRRKRRGPNVGTVGKVAEARLMMEDDGILKSRACERAGIDPKTLNRWYDFPKVSEEMEQLRKEKGSLGNI